MTNSITRIPLTLDMLPDTGNPRYKKRIRECERCCSLFIPRSPRTRFCDDCREIHEKEKIKNGTSKMGKGKPQLTIGFAREIRKCMFL